MRKGKKLLERISSDFPISEGYEGSYLRRDEKRPDRRLRWSLHKLQDEWQMPSGNTCTTS